MERLLDTNVPDKNMHIVANVATYRPDVKSQLFTNHQHLLSSDDTSLLHSTASK